jgi:hypothetical protein
MLGNLQQTIETQAKTFLATRLGESGLAQMFYARFSDKTSATQALQTLYDQALPPLKLFGSERSEIFVLTGPEGETGKDIQKLADRYLPAKPNARVASSDEVAIYREFTHVPLTALPQLGPIAEDAYNAALETQGSSPHCRTDVPAWQDVEVG